MNQVVCVSVLLAALLFPGSESLSPSCSQLMSCRNSIKSRTYQWLGFSSSMSRTQWVNSLDDICNDNEQELSCARQTGCDNSNVVMEANIAIGDRNFVCSATGRHAILRVRTEDRCIGNVFAMQAQANHRHFCYLYRNYITSSMLPAQVCTIVSSMRSCDVNNGEMSCSNISAYIIDQLWHVRIRNQFATCYNGAAAQPRALPAVPTA